MVFGRSVRHWHSGRLGVSLEVTHCIGAMGRHIVNGSATLHYTLHSMPLQLRTDSPCYIENYHLYHKASDTAFLVTSMPFSLSPNAMLEHLDIGPRLSLPVKLFETARPPLHTPISLVAHADPHSVRWCVSTTRGVPSGSLR
jgi:hypothetical protein